MTRDPKEETQARYTAHKYAFSVLSIIFIYCLFYDFAVIKFCPIPAPNT